MSLGTPSPTGVPSPQSSPDADVRRLQKVAVVELGGVRFDIAKNGGFHLVCMAGPDAYGNPVAEEVPVHRFLSPTGKLQEERCQALLDALGEALVKLQWQRDLRLGEVSE